MIQQCLCCWLRPSRHWLLPTGKALGLCVATTAETAFFGLMSASTSCGHAPALVEDRGVPKTAAREQMCLRSLQERVGPFDLDFNECDRA
jgi:hypothetical protein